MSQIYYLSWLNSTPIYKSLVINDPTNSLVNDTNILDIVDYLKTLSIIDDPTSSLHIEVQRPTEVILN